uniref:Ovule protein n=1 Tax=Parascaris univalens TaxID=6257 RepID=A0A915BHQ0_PARUN
MKRHSKEVFDDLQCITAHLFYVSNCLSHCIVYNIHFAILWNIYVNFTRENNICHKILTIIWNDCLTRNE